MRRSFKIIAAAVMSLALLGGTAASAAAQESEPMVPEETDCEGRPGVLVASDAQAQSDIYSAVTLAAAIDGCVILAGPRDGELPEDQYERAMDAETVAWIVGGTAAVPRSKARQVAANAERLGGADRLATARLVGEAVKDMTGTDDDGDDMDGTGDDMTGDDMGGDDMDAPSGVAATTAAMGTLTVTEGTWTVTVRNLTTLTCGPYVTDDGHDHTHGTRYDSRAHYGDDHPRTAHADGHSHGEATTAGVHSHVGDMSGTSAEGKHAHGEAAAHADHRVTHVHTAADATVYGHTGEAEAHGDGSAAAAAGTRHSHAVTAAHYHGSRHTHADMGHGMHGHGDTGDPAERMVTYGDFPITSSYADPGALDKLSCAAAVRAARQAVAANRNLTKPTAMVSNSGETYGGFSAMLPYSADDACLSVDPYPTVTHNAATAANGWAETWTLTLAIPADCTQTVTVVRNADADTVTSWSAAVKP